MNNISKLNTITKEMLNVLGASEPAVSRPICNVDLLTLTNQTFPRELDKAAKIMDALDPDMGYDHWVRIGMVMHYLSDGSQEGFIIWNAWSSGGEKYPGYDELLNKYQGFNSDPNTCVKMGTLIYIAREHGVDIYQALNGGGCNG